MKFILSLAIAFGLVVDCMATGSIGVNPPQSGVINFSASTGLIITNPFTFSYQSQPAVTVSSANGTNDLPFTVSGVTLTNFIVTVSSGTTTNASVAWQSFPAYPRVFVGTNVLGVGVLVTNTFPVPFVYPPVVQLADSITNGDAAATTVTTTNFVITVGPAETVYWGAFGNCYVPGLNTITY